MKIDCKILNIGLLFLIIILFLCSIFFGTIDIPKCEIFNILIGKTSEKESWNYIILNSRLPQTITAIFCGISLSVSGLILQTMFNNPLAGPSILGINSGASLGVAIVLLFLGGGFSIGSLSFVGFVSVVISAMLGSFFIIVLMLLFSSFVKNNVYILIIGLMIGYISSSAVSLLNFFSNSEGVHSYMIWGLGDFSGVSAHNFPFFCVPIIFGIIVSLLMCKQMNAFLLGEKYAKNLGVNIKVTRCILLFIVGLLCAVTTAFCGPISFIGLAVPHIARLLINTSNHNSLMPVTMLCGACFMLACNLFCNIFSQTIPINVITPIVGAPIIIYVILNQRKLKYFN